MTPPKDRADTAPSHGPLGDHGEPLSAAEAAEYLNLSKGYLYHLTSRREIPHYKPGGGRLYFLKSDLDDYLRQGKVDSQVTGD